MIVLSGALVLVALVLLVFGALDRNLPYVYASIGVSVLSLLLLLVGILQRRGELVGDDDEAMTPVTDTTAERVPALAGAGAHDADHTTELEVPAAVGGQPPASRRVVPDPAPVDDVPARQADEEDLEDEEDDHLEDEPFDVEDEDVEDEDDGDDRGDEDDLDEDDGDYLGDEDDVDVDEDDGVTVLVVSGRPRYHLEGCRVLRGKQPQALERDDARTHGFSPCGVCKPDADEAPAERRPAAATASTSDDRGVSFTEALFGEPLFADPSSDDADPARAGALPETDPAELHGDDPADEATLRTADEPAPEPAPDVDGDPDEAAREDAVVVDTPVVHSTVVDTTVVDTAVVDTTASTDEQPSPELRADTDSQQVLTGDEAGTEIDGAESAAAPDTSPEEPAPAAVEDVAPVQEPAAEDLLAEEPAERTAPASTARAGDATGTAATRAPAKKAPAKKVPAKRAPAKKAPAKGAPAKRAPAKRAPAKGAPAKGASGTSAKKTAKASPKRAAAPSAAPEAAAPAVRRPVVRAVRADALRLAAPGTGVSTTRVSARGAAPAPAASAPVVVVPDRDRYHRPECRFVRDVADASSLSKAAATREGYAACGVCKP